MTRSLILPPCSTCGAAEGELCGKGCPGEATRILDCGHGPTMPHSEVTTGYGYDAEGHTFCFACCAETDADTLRNCDKWTGYVTTWPLASDGATVSNWPGSLKVKATWAKRSPYGGGFGSQRTDVWFTFEGRRWHGVNRGDSQIIRCHTLKGGR